ncbi:MAG: hypothetical protein Athens071416_40 [Parcubacteria group bacterium Athens0714_16]|nr:MAG: hypothetical protein Athens071416_40 [Parcubacteria group bacterium Athens0714_16]
MKEEKIVEEIRKYTNQFVNEERIEKIRGLQRFLTFELRWSELTDEEREYVRGMPHVTDEIRKRMDSIKNENQREEYVNGSATSEYIKQLGWDNYLFGFSEEKPIVPTKPNQIVDKHLVP